jgi:hypothetical protein
VLNPRAVTPTPEACDLCFVQTWLLALLTKNTAHIEQECARNFLHILLCLYATFLGIRLTFLSGGRQRDTASVMNPAAEYGGFSYALPSRKRGADSARLSTHENQAKARRFSPPLFEDLTSDVPVNNSLDHGSVDFIDLTG